MAGKKTAKSPGKRGGKKSSGRISSKPPVPKKESRQHRVGIERVPTGIPALDRMLEGGLPKESITLLSGACGTGKSTFAMQFLYYGAKYCDEPGVYVTLEEDAERLISNMSLFGWDIRGLIEQKKLIVIKPEVYKFESIRQIIGDSIDKIGAKRLVVDSYSVMLTYFSDPDEIRNGLVQLDREIKKMGATALVISDIKDNSEIFSTTGVEEFIVDGVIVLYLMKDPKCPFRSKRAIAIRKMRATSHPLDYFDFSIGPGGVSVGGSRMVEAKPARKERQAQKKPRAVPVKKSSVIELGALRAKGGHSWKWKHL
ncbi:MAG: AAA family ATPase [Candidatus Micrarchaeota archaeon]|nr:AAA family ATPase [Candidatus Micrarchaeota archaeon]